MRKFGSSRNLVGEIVLSERIRWSAKYAPLTHNMAASRCQFLEVCSWACCPDSQKEEVWRILPPAKAHAKEVREARQEDAKLGRCGSRGFLSAIGDKLMNLNDISLKVSPLDHWGI